VNHQTSTSFKQELVSYPALHHPFLLEFSKGNLTLEQVQIFALQHYQLVRIFTAYLENLILRFDDEQTRDALGQIIKDEYALPNFVENSHPALYRRFMRSLNLSEKDWDCIPRFDATTDFICRHFEMTKLLQAEIGLGAIGPGHEDAIPVMFSYLVEGLRKFGLNEFDLTYFTLHIEQDKLHGQLMEKAISRVAVDSKRVDLIREGIKRSLELRYKFWSKLEEKIFNTNVRT